MLYDLQDLQLGSSDDVYADDCCQGVLFGKSDFDGVCGVADMETLRYDVSRTLLGAFQRRASMLGLHG
ncbi:MAG: hypothetical protein II896_00070 [Clostridia bacterium]|nr:hypothetical protein [Clostridia bacterium]